MSDQENQVVEEVKDQPHTPADGATSEPKVETGAAPTDKPSERVYSQKEVDAIAARVERREQRKRERDLQSVVPAMVQEELAKRLKTQEPEPQAPKRENFMDDASYEDARVDYRVEQKLREQRQQGERQDTERRTAERVQEVQTKFAQAVKAASELSETFADDFDQLTRVPMGDETGKQMIEAIAESDEAPQLLSYLSANPKEAQRIGNLSPARAVAEIGKLEAAKPWGKSDPPKTASVSNAPPPIEPVSGKGGAGTDEEPTDPDAYLRWHNSQERGKAAARMKRT